MREEEVFLPPFSLTVRPRLFCGKLELALERSNMCSNNSVQEQKTLSEQVSRDATEVICLSLIIPVTREIW